MIIPENYAASTIVSNLGTNSVFVFVYSKNHSLPFAFAGDLMKQWGGFQDEFFDFFQHCLNEAQKVHTFCELLLTLSDQN